MLFQKKKKKGQKIIITSGTVLSELQSINSSAESRTKVGLCYHAAEPKIKLLWNCFRESHNSFKS